MQQNRGETGGGGGGEEHNQEKRLKPMQQAMGSNQQQQPPPQKCPRCDSMNTKFCYYNNYSLSQPRYFCKTCRRYWTQGGTLRNVPVGGGCRKGKRSSSSKMAASSSTQTSTSSGGVSIGSGGGGSVLVAPPQLGMSAMGFGSFNYGIGGSGGSDMGGGFLNSLAAIQSLHQHHHLQQLLPAQQLQSFGVGGAGSDLSAGGSSSLSLLRGFDMIAPSLDQVLSQQQQRQLFNTSTTSQDQETFNNLIQSTTRPDQVISSSNQNKNWELQGFMNTPALWSSSSINTTTSIAGAAATGATNTTNSNTNTTTTGGSSSNLNQDQDQWRGSYAPPPP